MPTVLRVGPYRFHFYSDEGQEPPHIHVRTADGECKFWLNGVRLARSRGIKPPALREIERLVYEHHDLLLQRYHDIHSQG
jgi:hypothetical protein